MMFKYYHVAGQEKGMYAWIATNYALGTLGGEPQETIGIVDLGGTSLQVFLDHQFPWL